LLSLCLRKTLKKSPGSLFGQRSQFFQVHAVSDILEFACAVKFLAIDMDQGSLANNDEQFGFLVLIACLFNPGESRFEITRFL